MERIRIQISQILSFMGPQSVYRRHPESRIMKEMR